MSGMNSTINRIGNSVMTRLMVIGILVLTLLVPVEMIKGIIHERETRRQGVTEEVSAKWGREQTVTGPILTVPYNARVVDDKGNVTTTVSQAHILPPSSWGASACSWSWGWSCS